MVSHASTWREQVFAESPKFAVLGPVYVHDGVAERPVAAAKLRVILAVLLLRAPRSVTVDDLADLVWDDQPPRKVRGALNTYVFRLRQALGALGDRIRTVPSGYVIDVDQDELDLGRFEALRGAGVAYANAGAPADAAAMFRGALDLLRGEPLADVDSSRIQRDDGHRLAELRIQTWEAYLDAEIAVGRHREILGDLGGLVAQFPLHERFHEQWMLALYRLGRRADALAAFQAVRTLLVDELGIEPGPGLQQLQRMALDDGPAEADTPVVPAQALLPGDLTDFANREAAVAALVCGLVVAVRGGDPPADPGDVAGRLTMYRSVIAARSFLQVFDDVRDTAQIRSLIAGW